MFLDSNISEDAGYDSDGGSSSEEEVDDDASSNEEADNDLEESPNEDEGVNDALGESPNEDQDFGQNEQALLNEEDTSKDELLYPFLVTDEIAQYDGTNDESDSEEDYDFEFTSRPNSKRARIESDEDTDPNDAEDDLFMPSVRPVASSSGQIDLDSDIDESNEDEAEDDYDDSPSFQVEPGKVVSKDGRDHIPIAHSGKSYIFFKSHRAKSSNISRHVNDILTMSKVEKSLTEKPVLCLLLDDGGDWGGRGLQTMFYLGDLWLRLDLDLLIISRNAPGQSRFNPIER